MHAAHAGADLLPGTSVPLGHLLGRVEHRISRRIARVLAGGPSLEQWRVLELLSDGEGHPMSEIAAHALVPAPTLTKIVDRLVDSALVYRRPDEADRRRVLVLMSDHGREVHGRLAPEVARAEDEVLERLGGTDRAELVRLLEQLVD